MLIAVSALPGKMFAQCIDQVTHTSGTAVVAGSSVTVTTNGCIDVNTVYCAATTPYFIGYDYSSGASCTGSYTFTFSPPINGAMLNFSGISSDPANDEIVVVMVNNMHYAISAPGTANACDPMAVLTPSGDVGGCSNCGVSGWNGTPVSGPISTLTVIDSVLMGAPAGSLFSLFICPVDPKTGIGEMPASAFNVYPNPAADQLSLTGIANGTPFSITDATGRIVLTGTTGSGPVDISALASGLYAVILPDARAVRFVKQ